MASGDTLITFTPGAFQVWGGATVLAAPVRGSLATTGSYPRRVMTFNATTDAYMRMTGFLADKYDGGGVTVYIHWAPGGTNTGDVKFVAEFERYLLEDLDAHQGSGSQTVTTTASGTNGLHTTSAITFTDGANMDLVTAGDGFSLRVYRWGTDVADTCTDSIYILGIEIKET